MITAYTLKRLAIAQADAESAAAVEMPKGTFVLVGIDAEFVYFNVACKMSQTNAQEIKDLKEKTGFETLSEKTAGVYVGEFRIAAIL